MISIDPKKTIIAGEAIEIITEMAAVVDRIFEEISKKSSRGGKGITYDEAQAKFGELVSVMYDIRKSNHENIHPHQLIDHPKVRKLFPESEFGLTENNRENFVGADTEDDSEDLLKKAMQRLGKISSNDATEHADKKDKKTKKAKKDKKSKKAKKAKNSGGSK